MLVVGLWRNQQEIVCLRQSFSLNPNMEALKAEIASKRKTIQDDPVLSNRPSKYMKRGDIERLREEQELKASELQTSPEDPPSKPTRVSIHLSSNLYVS